MLTTLTAFGSYRVGSALTVPRPYHVVVVGLYREKYVSDAVTVVVIVVDRPS